ncbi:MAG TPA: heme exporter protein CcmB [Thiothrix sp.]|nr:heme exporter protein CcmB [Thiothrix sp.]
MIPVFLTILSRDLTLAARHKTDVLSTLFFFIIVISLFPLGVGVDKATLQTMAAGVAWVAALLASMLALERLFASDYADGTLEQMVLAPQPLTLVVLAKVFAHWLLTGLPMVIIAPLVGLQYHLSAEAIYIMMLALLLGTPILSLLGAIGAALTLGVRGGGVLIALLILPLYVPILIYGSGAVSAIMIAGEVQAYLLLLAAFLLLSIVFAPWAIAAALRIALE